MFSSYRGLPRTVWTVFAGSVVHRIGFMVTPFLVFFLAERDVTGSEVGYVLGALGAGHLIGPAVGGLLADRFGRRPAMLSGLLGSSAAVGALYAAPGVWTMAAAALLVSATGMMVAPAAYALMSDAVDAERRQRAYALFHWGSNIGTAVAGVLGGFLAAHGYWLLFAVDVTAMLLYATIVVTRLTETRPQSAPQAAGATSAKNQDGIGYGVVFRDKLLLALLPLFGIQLFVYSLTEVALPLAIHDSGLSPAVYGTMAAINAILVVVLQPFTTARLARLPQLPVQAAGSLLIAAGVALTGIADSVAGYAFSVAVWSLGEVVVSGIAAAVVADLAPAHARGRYQGAFSWTWGAARFAALTLGVTVYTSVGPATLWWTALAAGAVTATGTLALRGRVARRAAETKREQEAAALRSVPSDEHPKTATLAA
ncbi:MFS transporter [Streptomyces solicathayae]|uniref:MFS transporter n=1 Tax=Streptomyces solicathayae TaxID=3081768 RepID=A0ABZ0LW61_9ACTN|nr:MFS transporter [Streptomyces sp. HUAS YS2]WOX23421.1 MFS transporter [Streptomyces sp. HUAS YS2]